jgi:hypothetical protein
MAIALTASTCIVAPTGLAQASISGTVGTDGEVTATASTGAVHSTGDGNENGSRKCRQWTPLDKGQAVSVARTPVFGPDLSDEEARKPAIQRINGCDFQMYTVVCAGSGTTFRWVPVNVTVDDLIPGITDIVRGQLQPPIPNINPTAESNGIVNLGMWLAVEPQTLPPITAQAGPATWITVTPTLTTTTYDFGNGDTVTCDGTGIPIRDVHPDLDVIEQSPTCGYTYRLSSPEDEPYQLTITTTWELPYTSSSGPGQIPPLDRNLTIDYDVDEIQTLGTNG